MVYVFLATMDVRSKSISDLCTDQSDCYLAVVEVSDYMYYLVWLNFKGGNSWQLLLLDMMPVP